MFISLDNMNEEIKAIFDGLFHSDYNHRVLICKPHGYALMPERRAILGHVRLCHTRKKGITKNISTYLQSIGPLLKLDHVPMLASGGPPVPFLKINSRAYKCNGCQEVLGCLGGIKTHLGDVHRFYQSTEDSRHWTYCTAETFSNRKAKYFHVAGETSSPSFAATHLETRQRSDNSFTNDSNIDEMIESRLRKFDEEERKKKEKLQEIERQPFKTQLTPWMRRTG